MSIFLSTTVGADWTCLDIGANIGLHTLTLATLATAGRVIAFEADPRNFGWLVENLSRLHPPHGQIELIDRALWDRNEPLQIVSFAELAGCSFISMEGDAADGERRIRGLLGDHAAVRAITLHRGIDEVAAERLDDWVDRRSLERLDIVKMDVEGAEARILRGGAETFRRFRPILLTEYNPSCAVNYFADEPSAYFDLLRDVYEDIRILEPDGVPSARLGDWADLADRLESQVFVDLVCSP